MDSASIKQIVSNGIDEERVIRLVQALVRTPSYQTERFETDLGVQRFIAETVKGQTEALGLPSEIGELGNLIIRIGRQDARRRLIIFGYAMTHPAGRMPNPTDGRLMDGATQGIAGPGIRGRGAAEQKGTLGAVLEAAALVKRHESALTGELVVCVSSAGETGRHDAARAMMRSLGDPEADMAIVAIGTGNAICLANKGRVDIEIVVRGRSAHSSTPWLGVNAIDGAREVLNRLAGIRLEGEHPKLGRPTLTVTAIRSFPDATHTIQDEVRLVVDRRLLPGQKVEPAVAEVREAVGQVRPFEITIEQGPVNLPAEVAPDSPIASLLGEAMRAAGLGPRHHYSHGCVDAGFFIDRGIPAVMFGPGDQRLWHTDDEIVAVADLVASARSYAYAALAHLSRS